MNVRRGRGFLNKIIDKLPVELHIPGGYQYCGPGTKLTKRLKRGDAGTNALDKACKKHDIAYSKYSKLEDRHRADAELRDEARKRVDSKDSSFGERASAWAVAKAMNAKIKLGMAIGGDNNRKKRVKKSKNKTILKNDVLKRKKKTKKLRRKGKE